MEVCAADETKNKMKLRHAAMLALVWVITAEPQVLKPGIYLMPGIFAAPPYNYERLEFPSRKACTKARAQYQKAVDPGRHLRCVEKKAVPQATPAT